MPLETLWEAWFQSAAGVVPIQYLKQQICDSPEAASVHPFDCELGKPHVSSAHAYCEAYIFLL